MKPSRNDLCPCGSGRKFKRCCGMMRSAPSSAPVAPQPRSLAIRSERARRLRDAGDLAGAASILQQIVQLTPRDPAAHKDLGLIFLRNHQLVEAVRCFERALALDPRLAAAHHNLGFALERQGDDAGAVVAYRRAAGLDPKLVDAHYRLGNLLLACGKREQALECYRHVAQTVPNSTLGRLSRAKILHQERKPAAVEECLRRAVARDPTSSAVHHFLGKAVRESGRLDDAVACFERAIALNPDEVAAYYELVQSKQLTEADRPLVGQLLSLLNRYTLTDKHRAVIHFALAKGLDDLGEHEQAMRQADDGNRIIHRTARFDRAQFAVGTNRLIASFTPDFFNSHTGSGTDCERPVLIVGMIHSATTLVEQILSGHPKVAAGGELMFWQERAEAYSRAADAGPTDAPMKKLAEDYRILLHEIGPQADRVTDSMPANFLWIGLIHLAFPKARIIHCRPHPIDTCLSIYFTDFAMRKEFAYDRGDIAFYYGQYARLMAHWREVLPPDRFLEVDYEDLIANREAVTRRLVGFVGLEWSEICLRPGDHPERACTASAEHWRRYEPWLGEFRQFVAQGCGSAAVRAGAANAERLVADRLRKEGKLSEAMSVLHQAIRLGPPDPAAYNDLGVMLLACHRVEEALGNFERAIALDPEFAAGYYNLAAALERQRRRGEAIAMYRRCVALAPDMAVAHSRLGDLLYAEGERAHALDCFAYAAAASPGSTLGRINRAKHLLVEERLAEAEECLRDTVERDPQSGEAYRLLGSILREAGRFGEAATCLERAIALDPELISAYHDLVQSKKVIEADRPLLTRMSSLVESKGLTDHERTLLHFGLGKAFDDLAAYDQAIRHFDQGNRLERSGLSFDRPQFAAQIDRLITRFTGEFFAAHAELGSDCATPVLILGMPRSGTTLVEQIVSSHPQIGAAGELRFWHERATAWACSETGDPQPISARGYGPEYLSVLRTAAPDAVRVTDKMPFNFLYLGIVHLIFPNAIIIHCRRNPLDTCLSIYFTRFATRQGFAYERGDLAFYYRHYARLMAHWRRVLPRDRFVDIDYEDLIANRERVTRRLIASIGLDWNDACLRPEYNRRPVKTASLWQVRQPVYDTSVERWRHYEPWLGDLRALLSDPVEY